MKAVVTKENLTKVSETTLVNILNTLGDDSPMALMIEAELDRRGDIIDQAKVRLEMRRESDAKYLEQLKSEVSNLFVNLKQGKMAKLVELFGDEFAPNYSYDPRSFRIVSHVAQSFNSAGAWDHDSEDDALKHLRDLIYHRIYDHHMRNATIESLQVTKLLLEGIK